MTTIYIGRDTALPARQPFELYPTERSLIRAALARYRPLTRVVRILDVGAGDGRWGEIARGFYLEAAIDGIEIRDLPRPAAFDGWYGQDFLMFRCEQSYCLILSNPPYGPEVCGVSMAERMVRHAWNLLAPGGMMIFLLRLSFQAGVDRYAGLWTSHPLWKLAVVSRRPSFYGGGTNGTDYGLYIWRKRLDGRPDGEARCWPTELLIYEREGKNGHR